MVIRAEHIKQPPNPGRESLSRSDIVKHMQEYYIKHLGLNNKIVLEVVNGFLEAYKDLMLESKRVEIRNFGVIYFDLMRGRRMVHPETGEEVLASPYYKITFKPSLTFRKKLRKKAKMEAMKS